MWVDETSSGWVGWLDASVVEETVGTQTQVGQFQPLDSRGWRKGGGAVALSFPSPLNGDKNVLCTRPVVDPQG